MSLEERMKELREQIATAESQEVEEVEEEKVEEPKPEPEPEPEKKEESPVVEEKPDDSAYAKMRRELAAEKRAKEKLEDELRRAREERAKPIEEVAESVGLPDEVQELIQETKITKAQREFMALESKFREEKPDLAAEYDALAPQYVGVLAASIKNLNRKMTDFEALESAKREILKKAGTYLSQGYDPIEELYHEAKDMGIAVQKPQAQPKEEPEIKPDLDKVARNMKRSAGMASAGGESNASLTKAAAVKLTVAEWAKLPAAERKRLLYS